MEEAGELCTGLAQIAVSPAELRNLITFVTVSRLQPIRRGGSMTRADTEDRDLESYKSAHNGTHLLR